MLILLLVRNAGWPLMLWFIHHRNRWEHLMLLRATQKDSAMMDPHYCSVTVFLQQHNKGYKYLIISNASSNTCLKADNAPPYYCLVQPEN